MDSSPSLSNGTEAKGLRLVKSMDLFSLTSTIVKGISVLKDIKKTEELTKRIQKKLCAISNITGTKENLLLHNKYYF